MTEDIPNGKTIGGNRMERLIDPRKYRGCAKKLSKRGTTWIEHTGNKLMLNWSSSTLGQDGINRDNYNEESIRTKFKCGQVSEPCKKSGEEKIWDHTYCREIIEGGMRPAKEQKAGDESNSVIKSQVVKKSCRGEESWGRTAAWRSNPNFVKTYSRKLSFKDLDDSMEWTAIEPGCAQENIGELRAIEALKQSVVVAVKTAAADALLREHEIREIRELRIMNTDLRRQNRLLKIENFKLQLRLATACQKKSER